MKVLEKKIIHPIESIESISQPRSNSPSLIQGNNYQSLPSTCFCFANRLVFHPRVRTSFNFFFSPFFSFFPRKRRRPPCLHVASVSTELLKVPSRISKQLEEPAKSRGGGRLQSRRLVKRSCAYPPPPISPISFLLSLCNSITKIHPFFFFLRSQLCSFDKVSFAREWVGKVCWYLKDISSGVEMLSFTFALFILVFRMKKKIYKIYYCLCILENIFILL